jgi:GcrA cell cycle regulator
MPANIWPRERSEYLAALWRSGHSFSQIAKFINEAFGLELTRSAVAGKVGRMGLHAKDRVTHQLPQPRAIRAQRSLSAAATKPAREPPRVPLKPRMIDILELTSYTCRYPYGDRPPYAYCGCPPLKGSPYCRDHTELCWNHPPLTGD